MRSASALLACAAACARISAPPPPPAPASVDPAAKYVGARTTVLLHGDAFYPSAVQHLGSGGSLSVDAEFRAFLGATELADVRWVDARTLSATVPGDLAAGTYGVSVEGPFGEGARAAAFRAVDALPASLSALASAPTRVVVGEDFTVDQVVSNTGQMAALDVCAGDPTQTGTAGVVQRPSEDVALDGGSSLHLVWRVHATDTGTLHLGLPVSGADEVDGRALSASSGVTVEVVAVGAVLSATLQAPPAVPIGDSFTVTLAVTNVGLAGAHGVQPTIALTGGAGVQLLSTPTASWIGAGQTVAFAWRYLATAGGGLQIASTAAGADDVTGAPVTDSAGASTLIAQAAPIAQDPFGDGAAFSYVFAYAGKVYLGPSADGRSAVRMNPDGTAPEPVSFTFPADPGNNDSAFAGPWHTLGFPGCTPDQDSCGPDNEDGRGMFQSVVLGGTEQLFATGARSPVSSSKLRHVYLSSDTAAASLFAPTTLALQGGLRGVTSVAGLGNALFVGFAANPTPKPVIFSFTGGAQSVEPSTLGVASSGTTLIDSMAAFGGSLYAANATGCSRRAALGGWTSCTPPGWSAQTSITTTKTSDFLPADRAVPGLVQFNGRLYLARNTAAGPQLWSFDGSVWQAVSSPGTGPISLLIATSAHLYVGYDGAAGVLLFRSNSGTPATAADFDAWDGVGLGVGATRILDGKAIAFGGTESLYLAAGPPLRIFKLMP
ncbi:MAG TPA: hypothetical protein VFE90_07870 [Myxococcales bacterium]|nr:hypothetical protein [Myxococcales bacterium]